MTALTDDTVLQRVKDTFLKRAHQPRKRSGYGNDAADCCLMGAVYLVCTDGRKTYESALETQTTPVGPTRSAFESAVRRLYDAIPEDERGSVHTGVFLTEIGEKCRAIELWYDTKADTHQAAADLAARA